VACFVRKKPSHEFPFPVSGCIRKGGVVNLGCCQISSAVSTVLRWQKFSCSDAVGAEQCGYGDLQ